MLCYIEAGKAMTEIYLTAAQVREMFGKITHMTLHRWIKKDDMGFPKPVYIGCRRMFKKSEIEGFMARIAGEQRFRTAERLSAESFERLGRDRQIR